MYVCIMYVKWGAQKWTLVNAKKSVEEVSVFQIHHSPPPLHQVLPQSSHSLVAANRRGKIIDDVASEMVKMAEIVKMAEMVKMAEVEEMAEMARVRMWQTCEKWQKWQKMAKMANMAKVAKTWRCDV